MRKEGIKVVPKFIVIREIRLGKEVYDEKN